MNGLLLTVALAAATAADPATLSPAVAPATEQGTLTATAGLRAEPRVDSPVTGNVAAGEQVRIDLRAVNGYCRVTTASGASGFVPLDVVALASEASDARPNLASPRPPSPSRDDELAQAIRTNPQTRASSAAHAAGWTGVLLGSGILIANQFRRPSETTSWQAIRNVNVAGLTVMAVGALTGIVLAADEQ